MYLLIRNVLYPRGADDLDYLDNCNGSEFTGDS